MLLVREARVEIRAVVGASIGLALRAEVVARAGAERALVGAASNPTVLLYQCMLASCLVALYTLGTAECMGACALLSGLLSRCKLVQVHMINRRLNFFT